MGKRLVIANICPFCCCTVLRKCPMCKRDGVPVKNPRDVLKNSEELKKLREKYNSRKK